MSVRLCQGVVFNVQYFSGYLFFFFKQKTAYEMRISDWSSDVCSSDLSDCDPAERRHRAWTSGKSADLLVLRANPCLLCNGHDLRHPLSAACGGQIGRASCRERVCQYV